MIPIPTFILGGIAWNLEMANQLARERIKHPCPSHDGDETEVETEVETETENDDRR